jgi:hypothetical protein
LAPPQSWAGQWAPEITAWPPYPLQVHAYLGRGGRLNFGSQVADDGSFTIEGVAKGKYLELVWEVLDGECKGSRVWQRIMTEHTSEKCVVMGRRKLSSVCHALDVMQLNDSSGLHSIPTTIRVSVKEEAGYEPTNEVAGFPEAKKATEGGTPF